MEFTSTNSDGEPVWLAPEGFKPDSLAAHWVYDEFDPENNEATLNAELVLRHPDGRHLRLACGNVSPWGGIRMDQTALNGLMVTDISARQWEERDYEVTGLRDSEPTYFGLKFECKTFDLSAS